MAQKKKKRFTYHYSCVCMYIGSATILPWLVSSSWAAVSAACGVLGAARSVASLAAGAKALLATLLPLLAMAALCAALNMARMAALSVQQRLTSGMHEYPPPRNRKEGATGTARELRTVEQGRSS